MGLPIHNGFSYGFNLFEANDCHRSTSNHEAHTDNEEKVKKLVSQRTLGESPMRNLKKKQKIYIYICGRLEEAIQEFQSFGAIFVYLELRK